MAGFDGFYLTRGHYSNNASATLHDVYSDRIAWFTHCTKHGKDSNWQGTSSGAESDMLSEILGESEGPRLLHQPASHGSRHFCQCHCLFSFSRCSHHLPW